MNDAADPSPDSTGSPLRLTSIQTLYGICVLLFSAMIGALLWELVIDPGLVAIRSRSGLGDELSAYISGAGNQAILMSPAIFMTSALWSVTAILRRLRSIPCFDRACAGSLADAGAALMWAGVMQIIGVPTLWAWTHSRMGRLVIDYDLAAIALIAVGVAIVFTGQALRARPVQS